MHSTASHPRATRLRTLALAVGLALGSFAAQAEEFVVGSQIPLTGSLARVGNGMLEGIKVAVEVFNARNTGNTIRLEVIDDESVPAKAVAAVEKLAADKVVALSGGYGSNLIGPASEAAEKAGLTYVTSGGVSDELTRRGLKHFFRINNNAGYAKAMAGLFEEMKLSSVAIVYSTKDATEGLAKAVAADLEAHGIKVTLHAFDPAITDFKPIINKVRLQDRAEGIAMVGYENDYVGILRAAKVLKPSSVKAVVGVWSLATAQMAQEFPELMPQVYGTAMLPFPVEFKSEAGRQFAAAYERLYHKEPDYLGQFGYVQSMLLFEAIDRAAKNGTLAKGGLSEELRRTDAETIIGQVTFDANGDNPHFSHRMGQHQNGKVALVWPDAEATAPKQFPGVPW